MLLTPWKLPLNEMQQTPVGVPPHPPHYQGPITSGQVCVSEVQPGKGGQARPLLG